MIRQASGKDQAAVMALWKHAFLDTEEYMALWFEEFYPRAKTLVYEQEHTLKGALQLLPVTVKTPSGTHTGYYVGGVSVWEEFRHQRVGSRLMEAAKEVATQDGMAFCLLIADVVGYYERFGYRALSHRSVIPASPTGRVVAYRPFQDADGQAALSLYRAFAERHPSFQIRTEEEILNAVRLERASHGDAVLFTEGGEAIAMAMYDTAQETLFLDEAVWKNEAGKEKAICFLHEYGKDTISVRCGETFDLPGNHASVMILPLSEISLPPNGYYNVVV